MVKDYSIYFVKDGMYFGQGNLRTNFTQTTINMIREKIPELFNSDWYNGIESFLIELNVSEELIRKLYSLHANTDIDDYKFSLYDIMMNLDNAISNNCRVFLGGI